MNRGYGGYGRYHHYGGFSHPAYGAPDPGKQDDVQAIIAEYAPTAKLLVEQVTDPTQRVEVLRAQIVNTKKLLRRSPVFLKGPIRMRLRKLKARLKAAERRTELQREQESSRRTWRALGQVGVVIGALVGVAIVVRLLRR